MMEFRNPRFNAHGSIDLEANHPSFGWIPMTVSQDDQATAEMYEAAQPLAAPYAPPAPSREALTVRLAARRFEAEESGTTFNGFPLATDRTTQAKITAAYVKATANPLYVIASWKFGPGLFAPLDAAAIIAAANAIEAHVQACFANEARISAQIEAATTSQALAAIDLEAGWPV